MLAGIGCPEDKLHVSPCGFNRQRFIPTSRLAQRIIAVGRLVEKKAPHLTIQAFGRIAARFPEARLDMIGGGPLADRCTTLISHCGLDGRVQMHGVQGPDFVAQLMGKASMFVQHSVTTIDGEAEGLPVAILEAMGSALPIVATRHSGIPEAVQDGITGLLVNEYDVGGMAAAISELLDDPDRAAAMGAAARGRALEFFTQEHTRDRIRAIIGLAPFPPCVPAFRPPL
jgi:glycosyltransferase involved in cell wall biosynthesis